MRFTIRDLLWLTVMVALGVAGGCIGRNSDTDEIQYFAPGPEFKKSQGAAKDSPHDYSAPAPNPPSE
jgi:hypothetical protein